MSIQNNTFSYLEDIYPESIRLYKSICEEITYWGTEDKQIYPCCRPVDIDDAKERYEWRYRMENNIPNGSILIYILDWESMFQNALKILIDSKLVNLCWNNESLFLTLDGYSDYVYYILGSMPDSIRDAGFFLNPHAIMNMAISKQGEYKTEHKEFTPIAYANYMYSHPIEYCNRERISFTAGFLDEIPLFAELSGLDCNTKLTTQQISMRIFEKLHQENNPMEILFSEKDIDENYMRIYLSGKWTCGVFKKNEDGTYSVTPQFVSEYKQINQTLENQN